MLWYSSNRLVITIVSEIDYEKIFDFLYKLRSNSGPMKIIENQSVWFGFSKKKSFNRFSIMDRIADFFF